MRDYTKIYKILLYHCMEILDHFFGFFQPDFAGNVLRQCKGYDGIQRDIMQQTLWNMAAVLIPTTYLKSWEKGKQAMYD